MKGRTQVNAEKSASVEVMIAAGSSYIVATYIRGPEERKPPGKPDDLGTS